MKCEGRREEEGEKRGRQHTSLRPTKPSLASTHSIASPHEQLPQPAALPRWKNEDTREVVGVPRQLLLTEEADHLPRPAGHVVVVFVEEVVEKGADVKADALVVDEELCEERQVLREELVVLAVELVQRVAAAAVDGSAGQGGEVLAAVL